MSLVGTMLPEGTIISNYLIYMLAAYYSFRSLAYHDFNFFFISSTSVDNSPTYIMLQRI